MAEASEKDETEQKEEKGEYEQITLVDVLLEVFEDIDKQIGSLDDEVKKVTNHKNIICKMIYKKLDPGEIPPELKEPDKFRNALDQLHNALGKTIDYVIRVEKTRKKMNLPIPYADMLAQFSTEAEEESPSPTHPKEPQQPVSVSVTGTTVPPPQPGFWGARAQVKVAQIYAELERDKMKGQTVVTTRAITDIVQFGRQLLPAFNKVKQWLPGALALISVYDDPAVCFLLHEECATYLSQTLGSLVSFMGACVEYRKNLLQGRKLGMARAFGKIAEAESYGPKIIAERAFSKKGFQIGEKGITTR